MNYKVGIIGYGVMGKTRNLAITEIKRGKVVAISEPNLGADFEGIPNLSHEEIINHPDLDVIVVCTPNFLNKDLTIRALNAGKHVFCEKPPAFTGADIEEIIIAEKNSGKVLMYGFNHRHHDSVMHMKRLIDSNEYGKVLWLRGRYGKSVTADYFNQWRAKKELAGGGILMDQGIHMLDLFLFLSGDFDVVKAEVSNLYWHMDVEDNAFVILKESATGKVASLHSTMSQWRHLFSLEIFLEKGYMVLNGLITSSMSYGEETLSVAKNRSTAPAATWQDEVITKYVNNNSWRYEMDHFFDAIDNNKSVTIGNSDDALKLMRIIDKVYEQKDF
ncbi:Gfo/Idh/MocA family oxidoreductase [Mucilaginibacter sp. BJC16-A38]|uniref:Gfo/Idh/MocA family protein n=1 Tax=Mucilaginibacter phenanthrenivorans TaxID=1234842 RepID=UPI002157FCED|nr:Gfo/Idh/MocA family oxidoreductase [Mucilaginibacter phenanthrenivorans]MCR8559726.1 Gfo/Idh/MocA family oxidoreductase [Mucilaginibacter phenanthrenivorans]